MDNVNDIIDMLMDRLVEATRKTNRIKADYCSENKYGYSWSELYEAQKLEDQLRNILCAITGSELFWSEDDKAFLEY